MKSEYLNLSIEQEFTIHCFERASHNLPPAELRKLFIEATRQLLIKDKGTLFRNGSGLLDINDISVRHPFDGDGMICQITFQNGRAHFRNRFIQTKAYLAEIWHSNTLDCCTAGLCRRTCFCTSSAGHEDDGWLIVMVYDGVRDRSAVVVLDAADLTKGAIATLHLTHHIPYGLHGSWTDTVFIDDLANS